MSSVPFLIMLWSSPTHFSKQNFRSIESTRNSQVLRCLLPALSCWLRWPSFVPSLLWVFPLRASPQVNYLFLPIQREKTLSYSLAGLVAIISSIAGAAGVLFSLLRFVGATMALPSAGTIFAGVATRVARMRVPKIGESVIREILSDSIGRGPRPGGADAGDNNAGPPPYSQATPHEYLLTKLAIEAIVKSWDIPSFNPPGTDAAYWLSRLRDSCEVYGVPLTQRALCATYLMRTDCREAANAAGCHDMTWDQFTTWLLRYDGACVISNVPFMDVDATTRCY